MTAGDNCKRWERAGFARDVIPFMSEIVIVFSTLGALKV
jgi:hypothetical protein